MVPSLIKQEPDIAVIHVGCNNINSKNIDDLDKNKLANEIIEIGKICREKNVLNILIPSIFVKRNLKVSAVIRQVNDILRDLCVLNNFNFIGNLNITRESLSYDGIHLSKEGTVIFAGNIVDHIKKYILVHEQGNN